MKMRSVIIVGEKIRNYGDNFKKFLLTLNE